jgi:hypothetical protein
MFFCIPFMIHIPKCVPMLGKGGHGTWLKLLNLYNEPNVLDHTKTCFDEIKGTAYTCSTTSSS